MSDEVKFTFDLAFQTKLLKLMIDDPNVLIRSITYVKKHYFETQWLQWVFDRIVNYYNKYQKIVTEVVMFEEVKSLDREKYNLIEYLDVVKQVFKAKVEEPEYIITKLEEFIKRNIFIQKMKDVADLYNKNKFDEALIQTEKCWTEVSQVNFNDTDRTFFFKDIKDRLLKRETKIDRNVQKFSTGVLELDALLHGGMERGELGIIVADAKVGKSIGLVNVGASLALSGYKVVHFNLEGRNDQVEDRYEARLLNMDYHEIKKNHVPREKYQFYERTENNLVICNMLKHWNYTVLDIEKELRDLQTYGFIPDVIIVDYGDLLSPREASKDNSYQAQQETFRDLKTLANKHNAAVWTASQVSRPPLNADPRTDRNFVWTRRNLADCYAKVRIADLLITLNMTEDEKQNHMLRVYVDAYRDTECGQTIQIGTNYANMQFYVPTVSSYQKLVRSQ